MKKQNDNCNIRQKKTNNYDPWELAISNNRMYFIELIIF